MDDCEEIMTVVAARIPARLGYILTKEAKERGVHFAIVCGEKIMQGVDANRIRKEISNAT